MDWFLRQGIGGSRPHRPRGEAIPQSSQVAKRSLTVASHKLF